MKKIKNDCYICQNTLEKFEKMMFCAVLLWNTQPEFREKTKKQPYFCLEHASEFVETASSRQYVAIKTYKVSLGAIFK